MALLRTRPLRAPTKHAPARARWVFALAALALVTAACSAPALEATPTAPPNPGTTHTHAYHGLVPEVPEVMRDIRLTSHTGEPFTLSEQPGELRLVYFGYTFCPDVCPLTMGELRQAVRRLPPERQAEVRVVMVTVDPERDTPEVLARYVAAFDPSFTGAGGDPEAVRAALESWGVRPERSEVRADGSYFVGHPAVVYVLDRDLRLRLLIPFGTPIEDISADLLQLLDAA